MFVCKKCGHLVMPDSEYKGRQCADMTRNAA